MRDDHIRIVADAHIWGVNEAFSSFQGFDVDLQVVENKDITRELLQDTDILLTRSSTRVDAELLNGTNIRFAATATIGDDHYDKAWLETNGISWANAAGSSTGSVIEYMVTILLELHMRELISISDSVLGIVGVGRIGTALANVCKNLGIQMLFNDPPRERVEGEGKFSSMRKLLAEADIVTLHTPLLRDGDDKTFHLIDSEWLSRFQGRGIINAARGECVDSEALLKWLDGDARRFAVIDCWECEPNISKSLLAHPGLVIATPHIAGHSLDGKAANTQYVYNALCRELGIEPEWSMNELLPAVNEIRRVAVDGDLWRSLHKLATALCPIIRDDQTMKAWLEFPDDGLADSFTHYRRNYPVRRSWGSESVEIVNVNDELIQYAHAMGINLLHSGG